MELQGTVKAIGEIQTFASGFQKMELVLLTREQYPQPINIEFLQDKINLLDNVHPGEDVKIGINIRGREWVNPQGETKYFNSITGWRIEKLASSNHHEPTQPTSYPGTRSSSIEPNSGEVFNQSDDEDDDLPF